VVGLDSGKGLCVCLCVCRKGAVDKKIILESSLAFSHKYTYASMHSHVF